MNSLNSLLGYGKKSLGHRPLGHEVLFSKNFVHFICAYKMENMTMLELKALARECRLRGYSQLRKAELIAFLRDNEHWAQKPPPPPPQMSTWEPDRPPQMSTWEPERERENEVRQPELEAPLIKRQLKHRRNKDSKLAKNFKSLDAEIRNLKSQNTNARFKRRKIRSMKREADKIAEKLRESEQVLKLLEPRVPKAPSGAPLKRHLMNRNKRIEAKIAELNKKIRRAKNRRNKECLTAKRNSLRLELNWGPRQLEEAFGDAYRCYRIDGTEGMEN